MESRQPRVAGESPGKKRHTGYVGLRSTSLKHAAMSPKGAGVRAWKNASARNGLIIAGLTRGGALPAGSHELVLYLAGSGAK